MLGFLLAPKWLVFHAAIAAAVVSCVALGSWQFDIYRQSDTRHDIRAGSPVDLASIATPGEPIGDAADMPVTITGRYIADGQRLVPGRVRDGVLGSYIATPLEYGDESVVFIVRGWVHSADDPGISVPEGEVTITGHLLPPETSEHATVRSGVGVEPSEVAYLAPEALADATAIMQDVQVQGYVIARDESPQPATSPVALNVDAVAPIRDVSPWQNLSYWAQWWVFAAAAILFWFSAVRSAVRKRRTEPHLDGQSDQPQSDDDFHSSSSPLTN